MHFKSVLHKGPYASSGSSPSPCPKRDPSNQPSFPYNTKLIAHSIRHHRRRLLLLRLYESLAAKAKLVRMIMPRPSPPRLRLCQFLPSGASFMTRGREREKKKSASLLAAAARRDCSIPFLLAISRQSVHFGRPLPKRQSGERGNGHTGWVW